MKEIIVTSQAELDSIPVDFDGKIIIKFGTPYNRAVVNRRFRYSVVAWENSSVVAWGNSSVVAWGNSSVVARENSSVVACGNSSVDAWEKSSVVAWGNSSVLARGNSSVVARGNSSVEAWENSSVEAWENSSVDAWENSSVEAWGNSSVVARGNSSVETWGNSSVVARGNSSVEAWENSSVEAWENSSVDAWEKSSVVAWENSSVVAWGNTQVVDCTCEHNIYVSGNARIVYNPRNITEYLSHYGIQQSDGKVKLYKAVHKRDGKYVSDKIADFEYAIGEMAIADGLTADESVDCGHGIHIAYKEWAVDFGKDWRDLAILEVEADVANIVVPLNGSGKVRTDKVLVLREVPLEECGLLGKILAKKRRSE